MKNQHYIKAIIELMAKAESRRNMWENMEHFFGDNGLVEHARLREVCSEGAALMLDIIRQYFEVGLFDMLDHRASAEETLMEVRALEEKAEELRQRFEAELRPQITSGKEMR